MNPPSGLAKRLISAAEYLFVRKDPESALLPISIAIDRVARDTLGRSGRKAYMEFLKERMELITRVAFGGPAVLNMRFAIPAPRDEHGRAIKPAEERDGIALFSFEQIIYHVVRCKLNHEGEIASVLQDGGPGSRALQMTPEGLRAPFDAIALGLLFAVISEVDLKAELSGSIFQHTCWLQVPLIELFGQPERILALARGEEVVP